LRSGGVGLFEVGRGQAAMVALLMADHGLRLRTVRRDLSGIDRVLVLARQ
jgi:methylase of polypeptide subunit release factors